MTDAGSGWIEPEPIEPLRNPALQRPPTWLSVPRPDDVMWLDKNENLDPELLRFNRSLLERVDARTLSVYPEAARLYSAVADWCGVAPESLMLTPGSDGAIRLAFHAFVERGDRVVHTRPTFAMYPVYASIFGATPSSLEYRRTPVGPRLDVDDVVAHLERVRPRLFCLPNPDSPTGTVFDPDAMSRLVDVCGRIGTVFLVDEAYHPFYRHSMVPRVDSAPHLVVARSFSKAWGLAGLRLGYLVGHPRVIATIHKLRPMYEVGALSIALMEIAVEHVDRMEASVRRLEEGRSYFVREMRSLGFETLETHGNFQHVNFGKDAEAVHRNLEGAVLYRKGFAEDCLSGYSRFSLTTREGFEKVVFNIKGAAACSGEGV
ncbi:MAG: histidinol-phosphate aminotransferase family protein [Proteobacteria bacterium]|nr:MAG: histidinol-phosphate aminotransferase family protein [Pseudomonadota bacterium]